MYMYTLGVILYSCYVTLLGEREQVHLVASLERISIYISMYMYVIRQYGIVVPVGPCATGKRKAGSITPGYLVRLSELDLSTFYKQALPSVLRLMNQTTYLVNVQSAATVCCV